MFLEERLPTDAKLGTVVSDDYDVDVTRTASSAEYRRLIQPFPIRRFRVSYIRGKGETLYDEILALYHRAYGRFAGFRVKSLDDFTTNSDTEPPTAQDQTLAVVTAGSVYQLQKEYGHGEAPLSIGYPVRTIFKPVAGTVLVSIDSLSISTGWSVDTTTGIITFSANKTKAITAITKGSTTTINVGAAHGFVVGDSARVSGVVGMTQINGIRANVTAIGSDTITLPINSTTFSNYVSGGTINTRPQTGEVVKGGCEFDIPARFDSSIDVSKLSPNARQTGSIDIVEILNP